MKTSKNYLYRIFRIALITIALPFQGTYAQTGFPKPILSLDDHALDRPLFAALTERAAAVEVDIFLSGDELLVGQAPETLTKGRSLTNLYLEPLRLLVMQNNGQLYSETSAPFLLVLDIKTEAEATYTMLQRVLAPYERILTRYSASNTESGALSVFLTGNHPDDLVNREPERFAGIEADFSQLSGSTFNRHLTPLVRVGWSELTAWQGNGEIPADLPASLTSLTRMARDAGVILRVTDAPPNHAVWHALVEAESNLIDTNQLSILGLFLRSYEP